MMARCFLAGSDAAGGGWLSDRMPRARPSDSPHRDRVAAAPGRRRRPERWDPSRRPRATTPGAHRCRPSRPVGAGPIVKLAPHSGQFVCLPACRSSALNARPQVQTTRIMDLSGRQSIWPSYCMAAARSPSNSDLQMRPSIVAEAAVGSNPRVSVRPSPRTNHTRFPSTAEKGSRRLNDSALRSGCGGPGSVVGSKAPPGGCPSRGPAFRIQRRRGDPHQRQNTAGGLRGRPAAGMYALPAWNSPTPHMLPERMMNRSRSLPAGVVTDNACHRRVVELPEIVVEGSTRCRMAHQDDRTAQREDVQRGRGSPTASRSRLQAVEEALARMPGIGGRKSRWIM